MSARVPDKLAESFDCYGEKVQCGNTERRKFGLLGIQGVRA